MLETEDKSIKAQFKTSLNTLWQKKRFFYRDRGKALVLLVCVLVGTIISIARTSAPANGADANLDSGYVMALAATLQQGYVLGRDIVFNYGPLAQIINWMATLFTANHSAFDSFALIIFFYRMLSLVLLAGILMLLPQLRWKFSLFIFLGCMVLNIAFDFTYYRSLFLLVAALLLARALAANTLRQRLILAGSCGLLAFTLQLFTFEIGIYAIISTVVIIAILSLLSWRQLFQNESHLPVNELALTLGTLLGFYLLGNLLLSFYFTLTSPGYNNFFDYQLLSLELVRGYAYTFGVTWELNDISTWILALVIIFSMGMVIWYCKKVPAIQAYQLFCLLVFSLVELKSAITRSDLNHLAYACVPILLLFLILGNNWTPTGWLVKLSWAGLLIALLVSWPLTNLESFKSLGQVFTGQVSVTANVKRILGQNTPGEQITLKGLAAAVDPAKSILIFPHEYYYGLGLNKKILAPTIQAYAAHTSGLQQYFVDKVAENKNNLEILYGMDGVVSLSIDSVPNITRSPLIFEYIYKNFMMKTRDLFGRGYMLLTAAPERQDMVSTPINFTTEQSIPGLYIYRFNVPTRCSLIRLTPKISYPFTSLLGRPNNLLVEFWSNDKRFQKTPIVNLEPGKPFSTYISLMDVTKFDSLFTNENIQTKPLDSIQVKIQPTGLFGVNPDSVELTRLECITFKR